jgi:hypothetical protein
VWVETTEGGTWCCPECEAAGSIYDHTGEQAWRHLDTCQCRTYADGLWLSQSQPLQAGHLLPLRRSRPLSGSSDIMTTTCRGYPHETRKDLILPHPYDPGSAERRPPSGDTSSQLEGETLSSHGGAGDSPVLRPRTSVFVSFCSNPSLLPPFCAFCASCG